MTERICMMFDCPIRGSTNAVCRICDVHSASNATIWTDSGPVVTPSIRTMLPTVCDGTGVARTVEKEDTA